MKLFSFLLLCFVFLPNGILAQCSPLRSSALLKLKEMPFDEQENFQFDKNSKFLAVKQDVEKECHIYTYGRCRAFINDEQWYWSEVITIRKCEHVLTYSTSNEENFRTIERYLLRGFSKSGERSYGGLQYTLFENDKGQIIEVNSHPNDGGIMFWMINLY